MYLHPPINWAGGPPFVFGKVGFREPMLLGSVDSADASQVLYVSWNREDEKEARRCMSLGSPPLQKTKAHPCPS